MENIADCTKIFKTDNQNYMIPNKHILEARKKAKRMKELNAPSGQHCARCQKTMSFIAYSFSTLCRSCLLEIKKEVLHLGPKK
jgi:hypothetical protein